MKRFVTKENRALLSELVRTDFKLRYQGSVLGYAWSLLRPLFMFVILYAVFVKVLKTGGDIPHFPVYLLLGIVIWNFFLEMTTQSLGSIVGRGDLIRKIRIPRWMIVFSSSISAVINLFLNLIVVMVFMVLNKVDILETSVFLPLLLLEVYLLGLGLSLFLSAAFVKLRDLNYIWEVILQAGFYLTPILYALSIVHSETARKLILLNPMAQAIQDSRYVFITHKTPTTYQIFDGGPYALIPFVLVFLALVFGLFYFRKESKYFAENI
jgi:ABC-2 type transport system permease protein